VHDGAAEAFVEDVCVAHGLTGTLGDDFIFGQATETRKVVRAVAESVFEGRDAGEGVGIEAWGSGLDGPAARRETADDGNGVVLVPVSGCEMVKK